MAQSIDDDVAIAGRIDAIPKMLEVVCRTTGMGFAAVARVTNDRWVALAVRDEIDFGLKPGDELAVKTTICDAIRDHGRAVVIDHVREDEAYRDHPTPAMYGFQSYISVPILRGGVVYGTLCAIDPRPAGLKDSQAVAMLELFADLIAADLDSQDRLMRSEAALLDQREAAELREQFIAVMGHDLRNPLAAISAAGRLLKKTPLDDKALSLVAMLQDSVTRMAGLIDNVLDLARGRLGGGLVIERRHHPDMGRVLQQVIDELRIAHPDRQIVAEMTIDALVDGDARRLAQLLSNLVANGLNHGAADQPVRVEVRAEGGVFVLTVINHGEPIPDAARPQLFQPFSRAQLKPNQQGLGLGLYIAAEIARAHGGTLTVASDPTETRFAFRMPLHPAAPPLLTAAAGA